MTAGTAAFRQQQGTPAPECEATYRTSSHTGRRRRGARCTNVVTTNYIRSSPVPVAPAAPEPNSPVDMDTDSGEEKVVQLADEGADKPIAEPCRNLPPASVFSQVTDEQLVRGVGTVLTSMANLAEGKPIQRTAFHSIRVPGVTIHDYLGRIFRFFHCSTECYVLALIYIDRLIKRAPGTVVCQQNCHRLLITAMVLAAKNHDDTYYSNAFYAKVGGVPCAELNSLELRFLMTLGWRIHVAPEEYAMYRRMVCAATSRRA